MKREDKARVLRWMGIFSVPWVILGFLLWLATRPVKPTPGTEAVLEGVVADIALAPYPDYAAARDPFGKTRAYLSIDYGDGTGELFWEADVGAEQPKESIRNRRVRVTVAEERGCDSRVFTKIELLPDP